MRTYVSTISPAGWLLLCLLPLIFIVSIPSAADTLYVPTEDYPTIQSAINAAIAADVVEVADGTYAGSGNRDCDFLGKAITVRSANGPASCIIDCGGYPHRGFTFQNGESMDSVLEGLTIRNGYMDGVGGGGLYCAAFASPTITGCLFEGNKSWSSAYGGAIRTHLSDAVIDGCTFSRNLGGGSGGAVYCSSGAPTISNCLFDDNLGSHSGGAVAMTSTTGATISGNRFINNSVASGMSGGGIFFNVCANVTLADNLFVGNGGLHAGAVTVNRTSGTFSGNTVAYNTATGNGGGYVIWNDSTVVLTNEIIWGNSAGTGSAMYIGSSSSLTTVTIDCSDVEGGLAACYVYPGHTLNWGSDMFDYDPVFCDPENGDFSLAENSICTVAHQPVCGQIGAYPMGCGPMTVRATMTCTPSSGTLPFTTQMQAVMTNLCFDETRRISARIDILRADGGYVNGWRRGFANVTPSAALTTSWNQDIPALGSLVGDNDFTLVAVDVTPAPWNQPPHWPSGGLDSDVATVTGAAP